MWKTDEEKQEDLKSILRMLHNIGVSRVDVYYDGEGDSGSINDIEFVTQDDSTFAGDILNRDHVKKTIEDAMYEVLSNQDFDWVNNDGGYGIIYINTAEATATIKHNQRITETSYSEYEENL